MQALMPEVQAAVPSKIICALGFKPPPKCFPDTPVVSYSLLALS